MKKMITLFPFLIFGLLLFAQNDNKRPGERLRQQVQKPTKTESLRSIKQKLEENHDPGILEVYIRDVKKRSSFNDKIYMDSLLTQTYNPGSMSYSTLYKFDFFYNENDQVETIIDYDWLGNRYEIYERWTFEYESHGRVSSLTFDYPDGAGGYILELQILYQYDMNGNTTNTTIREWIDNMWVTINKTDDTYDNDNLLLSSVNESYDDDLEKLIPVSRSTYSYVDGNLSMELTEIWDEETEAWEDGSRDLYTYNNNDQLIEIIKEAYIEEEDLWLAIERTTFTYDSNGNLIEEVDFIYDFNGMDWSPLFRIEQTFDSNGNLTSYTESFYELGVNEWEALFREEFSYDNNNNLIQYVTFDWDENSEMWVADEREDYYYDEDLSFEDVLVAPFFGGFTATVSVIELFVWEGDQWVPDERLLYFYSTEGTTSTEDHFLEGFKVFPNPARDIIYFDYSSTQPMMLQIFDMHGKLIMMDPSLNKGAVSVQSIAQGMYIYRLSDGKGALTGKIFITR